MAQYIRVSMMRGRSTKTARVGAMATRVVCTEFVRSLKRNVVSLMHIAISSSLSLHPTSTPPNTAMHNASLFICLIQSLFIVLSCSVLQSPISARLRLTNKANTQFIHIFLKHQILNRLTIILFRYATLFEKIFPRGSISNIPFL